MTTSIENFLDTQSSDNSAINWHDVITAGFPCSALTHFSEKISLKEKQLRDLICPGVRFGKQVVLTKQASDHLYRAAAFVHKNNEKLSKLGVGWLVTENVLLKGRIPLDLMSTHQGAEYAQVALDRA